MASRVKRGRMPNLTDGAGLNNNRNVASFSGTRMKIGADGRNLGQGLENLMKVLGDNSFGHPTPPITSPGVVKQRAKSSVYRNMNENVMSFQGLGLAATDRKVTNGMRVKVRPFSSSTVSFNPGDLLFVEKKHINDREPNTYYSYNLPGINEQCRNETMEYVSYYKALVNQDHETIAKYEKGKKKHSKAPMTEVHNIKKFAESFNYVGVVASAYGAPPKNAITPNVLNSSWLEVMFGGRQDDMYCLWGKEEMISGKRLRIATLKPKPCLSEEPIDLDSYQPPTTVPIVMDDDIPRYMTSLLDYQRYLNETRNNPTVPMFIWRAIRGQGPAEFCKNCIVDKNLGPSTLIHDINIDDLIGVAPQHQARVESSRSEAHKFRPDIGYRDVTFRTMKSRNGTTYMYPVYSFCAGIIHKVGRFRYGNPESTADMVQKAITINDGMQWQNLRTAKNIQISVNV